MTQSPDKARNCPPNLREGGGRHSLALDISAKMFLGPEQRHAGIRGSVFRLLDKPAMRTEVAATLQQLGIAAVKSVRQQVETRSGGQPQVFIVAR